MLVTTHYMDEAERCHRIAYISDGRLWCEGTAREVVARSGLVTFVGTGEALSEAAEALRARARRRDGGDVRPRRCT